MNKILVLGPYGSGKSTFSSELSELIRIPVYNLDCYYWKKNWQKPSLEEWIEINKNIVRQNEWIIEGNYLKTLDYRIQECDTIIYIESNTWISFYRVIKRTLLNLGKQRYDLPEGCFDRVNFNFLKAVILFNKNVKPIIFRRIKRYNHKLLIHNSTAKDFVLKFLSSDNNNLHT